MGRKPKVAVGDCAVLANQAYEDGGRAGGWRRFPTQTFADDGFYAAAYYRENSKTMVVAVRGTQEKQDAMDDAMMIPPMAGERSRHAMMKMLVQYLRGRYSQGAVNNTAQLAHNAMNLPQMKRYYKRWGNQIPARQADVGVAYLKQLAKRAAEEGFEIAAITGHSLGGALAQFLSQQTGSGGSVLADCPIPGVAFNSPYMGTIAGTRRGSGGGILTVNCRLDPLSFLTREVGNTSHASLGSYVVEPTPFSELAPVLPNTPTLSQLNPFLKWLMKAMHHYHSMPNLVAKVEGGSVGGVMV